MDFLLYLEKNISTVAGCFVDFRYFPLCEASFCRILGPGKTHWGIVIALFGSTISLILFQVTSKWGWIFNVVFMLMAGVCNCGPDAFVSGSIAAELGERENAQSAVSGFVNGMY